jgi:hypothetical protein
VSDLLSTIQPPATRRKSQGRTESGFDQLDQFGAVQEIQDKFDLRPLSAVGKADWKAPAASLPALPDIGND